MAIASKKSASLSLPARRHLFLGNPGLCPPSVRLSSKTELINTERKDRRMKHGYLIDMDGVLYRGSELICGADEFLRQLRVRDIPFRLLTNNSQRTRRDVVAKVARMGIDGDEEHVFTSASATAGFLAQPKANGTAYVIAEGG